MFLLIAEFTRLYTYFRAPELADTLVYALGQQLKHPTWDEGMTFWDTIHPFFIFIVGVAMPFSFTKRSVKGNSSTHITTHVLKRGALLVLIGWLITCVGQGKMVFSFLNVLCSIGVSYVIAYFIMNKSMSFQLIFSLFLIVVSEVLYRYFPLEGYNNPFVAGQNFGYWVDVITLQTNPGYWSFFNKVPTTAHIIWGVLVGKLLLSDTSAAKKVGLMLMYGLLCVILGYSLSSFTPMIKRIATSTWVLASGGLAICVFAICYWIIDVKQYLKSVQFFTVVGVNPLFIYVFASIGGASFLRKIVDSFSVSLFTWTGEWWLNVISAAMVLAIMWYLCYWLYKKKIFFKV